MHTVLRGVGFATGHLEKKGRGIPAQKQARDVALLEWRSPRDGGLPTLDLRGDVQNAADWMNGKVIEREGSTTKRWRGFRYSFADAGNKKAVLTIERTGETHLHGTKHRGGKEGKQRRFLAETRYGWSGSVHKAGCGFVLWVAVVDMRDMVPASQSVLHNRQMKRDGRKK